MFKIIPRFLVLSLLWSGATGSLTAQTEDWTSFTSMWDIRALTQAGDDIWAATGGGVFSYSPDDDIFTGFTNIDGLTANDVTTVATDSRGRVWAALSDGNIVIIEPGAGVSNLIIDYESLQILDFYPNGDTMYVALEIGLGEYRIDKEETKEVYRQLGAGFKTEAEVRTALVTGGYLYAATEDGIARASLDLPNLKAPSSWQTFTVRNGLPDIDVRQLVTYDGKVVAGSATGISIETGDGWQVLDTPFAGQRVNSLAVLESLGGSRLYAAVANRVYFSDDLTTWSRTTALSGTSADLLLADGKIWAGQVGKGLSFTSIDGGNWSRVALNSPKTNKFTSLYFTTDSILWATSSLDGFMAYDGTQWYNFDELGGISNGDFRNVIQDNSGRIWLSTWGRGVYVLEGRLDSLQVTRLDTTAGYLSGSTTVNPGYVVVSTMTRDDAGTVWLANIGALNGRPIIAVTPENEWVYFSLSAGVRSDDIRTMLVDRIGRLWYGTGRNGVGVIDYAGTLLDQSDDDLSQGLGAEDNLQSLTISALAEDDDGTIWIGTADGLNSWFGGSVFSFVTNSLGQRLISENIKAIGVDPANNKWIGTTAGITMLGADGNTMTDYTTDNSPLVSNVITAFAFDENTGDVFIATTNGISVLRTPFTRPQDDFSSLKGYPNPFIISGSPSDRFVITNLVSNSGVRIFTEDGRLVKNYPAGSVLGAQVIWDGRDSSGELVPSGIYLYVGFSEDGRKGVGKIAVIRK